MAYVSTLINLLQDFVLFWILPRSRIKSNVFFSSVQSPLQWLFFGRKEVGCLERTVVRDKFSIEVVCCLESHLII